MKIIMPRNEHHNQPSSPKTHRHTQTHTRGRTKNDKNVIWFWLLTPLPFPLDKTLKNGIITSPAD